MPVKKAFVSNRTQRLRKNNMLSLSIKLTENKHLLIPATFLPLYEKFLTVLPCLSPSLHCNFYYSIFVLYLHINHSQHDFHKPLLQVLPQKTSLKSPSEIYFKAVLEGLDYKIFFDSFLGKFFIVAENVPALEFWPSYGPALLLL